MTLMTQATVRLLMVWLLVGPSALCRAGVLVECCDHESAETADSFATVESSCCKDGNAGIDSGQPAPDPAPRKCGACASVCTSAAKPSDDSNSTALMVLLVLPAHVVSEAQIVLKTSRHVFRSCRQPNLPYPHSDLPLLI